jgi:hypothetical protein
LAAGVRGAAKNAARTARARPPTIFFNMDFSASPFF